MWNKRWTDADVALFSRKLHELLQAGIPLLQALTVVRRQATRHAGARLLQLEEDLKAGKSFTEGIQRIRLPPLFLFLIASSEHHGQLADSLAVASRYYQKRHARKKKQQKALAYPLFILFTSVISFYIVMHSLLPQFAMLYESFQAELPWLTRQLLALSVNGSQIRYAVLALTGLLLGFMLCRNWYQSAIEQALLRIPIVSRFIRLYLSYIVTLQMAALLEGGITILQVCRLCAEEGHWHTVRQSFCDIQKRLHEGGGLSDSFQEAAYLLPVVRETILTAEYSGTLGSSLLRLSGQLEREWNDLLERGVSIMESCITLGVGFLVLLLMTALFLPLFNLINQI